MTTHELRHSRLLPLLAGGLLLVIFGLDTQAPAGLSVPMLYILPTLLFIGGSRFVEPLIVATLATVLTAVGFYLSPGGDMESGLVNRLLSTIVIWVTAALVVAYMRMVEGSTSQMRTANAALETSLRRLKDLEYALDQSAIVAATDQTGRITYVNDKFCEISKYSREELLGQDHRLINSGHHPQAYIRDLWRTIARGEIWRGELRNRAKDGTIYWVDTTIVPFLNDRAKPWQYLAIRSDITPRKLAEARLRDEAALTQMGRLSAVVAHEVRNPLAALRGSLQVLASRLPPDLRGREIITPMLARIDTLNQTVKDILTYSKPAAPKLQRVALRALLHEVAAAAQAAIPEGRIEVAVDAEPQVIHADPDMTRAALLNLLMNACHASNGHAVELTATPLGGACEIAVLDRGPGIPADVREHLFEPFITGRVGGTGLGLAIARRLTVAQGGTLSLGERPGGGTAAVLRMPQAPPAA